MRFLIFIFLLAVNAALAVLLAGHWVEPAGRQIKASFWKEPRPVKPAPDSMAVASVTLSEIDVSAYSVTTQRPLFFYTRRPPAPPPQPVVPPPPPPPPPPDPLASVELYGLVSLGEGKGGVIARVGGAMRQIRFGEKIGDWTLKAVQSRDAVFVGPEDKERRLTMSYRSLQQLSADAAGVKPGDLSASKQNVPAPAPTSFDQVVLDRRARINKARIDAGLKPFDNW